MKNMFAVIFFFAGMVLSVYTVVRAIDNPEILLPFAPVFLFATSAMLITE